MRQHTKTQNNRMQQLLWDDSEELMQQLYGLPFVCLSMNKQIKRRTRNKKNSEGTKPYTQICDQERQKTEDEPFRRSHSNRIGENDVIANRSFQWPTKSLWCIRQPLSLRNMHYFFSVSINGNKSALCYSLLNFID